MTEVFCVVSVQIYALRGENCNWIIEYQSNDAWSGGFAVITCISNILIIIFIIREPKLLKTFSRYIVFILVLADLW